jgi:hypothetical protein
MVGEGVGVTGNESSLVLGSIPKTGVFSASSLIELPADNLLRRSIVIEMGRGGLRRATMGELDADDAADGRPITVTCASAGIAAFRTLWKMRLMVCFRTVCGLQFIQWCVTELMVSSVRLMVCFRTLCVLQFIQWCVTELMYPSVLRTAGDAGLAQFMRTSLGFMAESMVQGAPNKGAAVDAGFAQLTSKLLCVAKLTAVICTMRGNNAAVNKQVPVSGPTGNATFPSPSPFSNTADAW